MNKIFQKMSMAALALLSVLALASCDAGDEDYTAGAPDPGYYLSASSTSLTYTSDENQVLALVVGRTDSTAAGTVNLKSDNSSFQVPSSVDFAAGEKSKTVMVPFDLPIGSTETVTFTVPSDESTVYGADSLTFTVKRDYKWESAGSGTFTDNILYNISGVVSVEHAVGTNIYRWVSPFNSLFRQAGESDLPTGGNIQFSVENGTVSLADGIYYPDDSKKAIPYFLYYDAANHPNYCNLSVEGSVVTINLLAGEVKDMKPAYTGSIVFDWTEGCPWRN